MSGLNVTPEALQEKLNEINAIDTQLDAAAGSTASVERTAVEQLLSETESSWGDFVQSVLDNLDGANEDVQAGTVLAIQRALDSKFQKSVNAVVKERSAKVEQEQADVEITDEEVAELEASRKELVNQFKALQNILEMFGMEDEISAIGEPKIRRGSRGPRGPRTLNKFHYKVNETDLPPDADSLSMVAKMCGVKTKELKAFISDQGIDLKKPPVEWTAELPNNVGTLSVNKKEEFLNEPDEDEAEEDEGTDEDE